MVLARYRKKTSLRKRFSRRRPRRSIRLLRRRRIGRRRSRRRARGIATTQKVRDDKFFEFPPPVQGQPDPNNNWIPVAFPLGNVLQLQTSFKSYRVLGARVWFRLRYPPPVEYFYNDADQLVGSRCSIHEIYYYPTGKYDQPTLNPRLTSAAREVTVGWQSTFVRFRDISRKLARDNKGAQDGTASPPLYSNLRFDLYPSLGSAVATDPDRDSFRWHDMMCSPLWRDSSSVITSAGHAGQEMALLGFCFKSDTHSEDGSSSAMATDSIEFRMEYVFQFKGRKPLNMLINDGSGYGNVNAYRGGTIYGPQDPIEKPTNELQTAPPWSIAPN